MTLYIIGAIICATIFALMTLDVIADLRMAKAINALEPGAALTEEQREWLTRNNSHKI